MKFKFLLKLADIAGMSKRRVQPRRNLLSRISVLWEDENGFSRSQTGLVEDRSLSGMGVSLHYPIASGTKVVIRGRIRELAGVVRHCRLRRAKYFIGIQLDREDETWNHFGSGV